MQVPVPVRASAAVHWPLPELPEPCCTTTRALWRARLQLSALHAWLVSLQAASTKDNSFWPLERALRDTRAPVHQSREPSTDEISMEISLSPVSRLKSVSRTTTGSPAHSA